MIKENDRKFLLPSEYENKYDTKFRRSRSKSIHNTFQRIFNLSIKNQSINNCITEYEDNELYETSLTKNTRNNIISYKPHDSINDLLSYKYAPKFRDIVY
jgi:hypothetical protein